MALSVWNSRSNDWSWAGSFTPSGVPVSNGDVVIPANATVAPTVGMSQGAVDLDSLRIEPGCLHDIGSPSSPLTIMADLIVHQGWGSLYLHNVGAAPPSNVDELVIDSPNWDNACTITGSQGGGPQNYTTLVILRGKVIGADDGSGNFPAIGAVRVGYRNSPQGDAIADFSAGAKFNLLRMNAGIVKVNNLLNTSSLSQAGGRVNFVEVNAVKMLSIFQSGGICDMRGYPAAGTDLVSILIMMGGVQTWLNDPRPKTIASALIMPGASLLIPSSVTITAGGSMVTPPIAA